MSRRHVHLLAACLALAAGGLPHAEDASAPAPRAAPQPYDESADADAAFKAAQAEAATARKPILVIFGANWCPDCRVLAHMLTRGKLAGWVQARYILVKVDVGNWDKNLALAAQLGYPIQKGIPAASVVSADGQLLAATQAGELAAVRRMGEAAVLTLFERLPTHPAR